MAFDGVFLAAIAKELQNQVLGGRIERIYQPEREEIHIIIRNNGQKYRLLISANAQAARVHLTETGKVNPTTPPLYCMVLRKHLEGGKITGIEQPGLERLLKLSVKGFDELGEISEKTLVIEIMGKHSNLVLVDNSTNIIIDGIKRYTHAVSRHREVLPGRDYIFPPTQGKLSLFKLTQDTFATTLFNGKLEATISKNLLNILDGFSPLLCRELISRSGIDEEITLNQCGEYEINRLWQALQEFQTGLCEQRFQPTLVKRPGGGVEAFAAFDLVQFTDWPKEHGRAYQVVDRFFATKEGYNRLQQIKGDLIRVTQENIQRIDKKLDIQRENLLASENAEDLRIYGELVTANIHLVGRGQTEITVVNYYHPEGETVAIPLEPHLSPAENAQYYFKKYAKIKNSGKIARQYLEEYEKELTYLHSVITNLDNANTVTELAEIREELVGEGYLKPRVEKGQKRRDNATQELSQPLVVESVDGFVILIGKNNKQNDRLTTKEAKPDDIWLHTKDIPGSHVVIRTDGKPVPDSTLEQAAGLAAYYSKGRDGKNVPVDYALRKYVHKPKGAKPGMVIYENQRTVFVEPEGVK